MKFREQMATSASRGGRIIFAADLPYGMDVARNICDMVERIHPHICAIKMNLQVLLPMGVDDIRYVTRYVSNLGLLCIADIKLNDIGNTNSAASSVLWDMGFDAIITNPIMGPSALAGLTVEAHDMGRGVISLCHMSSHEGAVSYEMQVGGRALYRKFLDWGLAAGVDGVVVGATFPYIIADCKKAAADRTDIISPGVGMQGGSAPKAFAHGSDYIIVGRSLINSADPAGAARSLLD